MMKDGALVVYFEQNVACANVSLNNSFFFGVLKKSPEIEEQFLKNKRNQGSDLLW